MQREEAKPDLKLYNTYDKLAIVLDSDQLANDLKQADFTLQNGAWHPWECKSLFLHKLACEAARSNVSAALQPPFARPIVVGV